MATLANEFLGIRSPNPFWLASGPPTDKEYNVRRAFEVGWGGVVWKTLGEDGPPAVNVNGPRYGVVRGADRRVGRHQQHRAHHRPAAGAEPARDQGGPVDRDPRGARLRGDRRRVRRLQPVRHHLPGGGLHHDGVAAGRRDRPAHRRGGGRLRELDDAPAQPGGGGRAAAVFEAGVKGVAGQGSARSISGSPEPRPSRVPR